MISLVSKIVDKQRHHSPSHIIPDRDYYNEFLNEFMKQEERHFSVERPEDHEGSVLNAVDNFSSPEPVINFSMSQGNGNGDISAMDI